MKRNFLHYDLWHWQQKYDGGWGLIKVKRSKKNVISYDRITNWWKEKPEMKIVNIQTIRKNSNYIDLVIEGSNKH